MSHVNAQAEVKEHPEVAGSSHHVVPRNQSDPLVWQKYLLAEPSQ